MMVKQKIKNLLARFKGWCSKSKASDEIDALYKLLYLLVHDKERSLELTALQTQQAFSKQWTNLQTGHALLSDPWFKDNVTRILCEEELLLKPAWFVDKRVLDAGCGNGRWSYGLAKLGAQVTAVDINASALENAKRALAEHQLSAKFVQSSLENLDQALKDEKFDLVFSWGVLHHCLSFNEALRQLSQRVVDGGILYLYLYGRESMPFEVDLDLFKARVVYNTLPTEQAKQAFLLKKACGDPLKMHIAHDVYAPLLNRRFEFDEVRNELQRQGFSHVERTIDHSELFIRAVKGNNPLDPAWLLPSKQKSYWFERYQ